MQNDNFGEKWQAIKVLILKPFPILLSYRKITVMKLVRERSKGQRKGFYFHADFAFTDQMVSSKKVIRHTNNTTKQANYENMKDLGLTDRLPIGIRRRIKHINENNKNMIKPRVSNMTKL